MAEFTVDTGALAVPSPNMPDQTGASRGITPNRAFEELFSGIGQVATNTIKQVDYSIQENIRKEAEAVFNRANAPYDASLPSGLKGSVDKVKNLQAAYDQGKLSDVHYYGMLNAEMKSMRSRYPGYEQVVDETLQSVTGVRPANAYKQAIDNEFAKIDAEKSDQSKVQTSWLNTNQEYVEAFFPDYFANPEKYAGISFGQIQSRVAQYQAAKVVNEDLKTTSKDEALQKASVSLNLDVNAAIEGLGNSLGFGNQSLDQILKNISTASYKPEELVAIGQGLDQIIAKQAISLRSQVSKNRGDSLNPVSWEALIGIDQTNALINNALAPLKAIREMVGIGDVSGAASYMALVKVSQDQNVSKILALDPKLPLLSALNEIDPALRDAFVLQSGNDPASILGTILPELMARIATGKVNWSDAVKNLAADVTKSEAERAAALNKMTDVVAEGKAMDAMTPEELKVFTDGIYGDGTSKDIFDIAEDRDYMKVFNKIFSPDATKVIMAKGDEETKKKYRDAAVDNFQRIPEIRNAANALNQAQNFYNWQDIQIDDKGHVQIVSSPDAPTEGRGALEHKAQLDAAKSAVDALNRAFDLMAPILGEADGEDMIKNRQELLKVLNINLSGGKKGSFVDVINDAFGEKLLTGKETVTDLTTTGKDPVVEEVYKDILKSDIQPISFDLAEQEVAKTNAADPNGMVNASTPFEAASAYLGMSEHNASQRATLAAFIQSAAGISIDPSKTAWCAAFVDAVLGGKGTGKLNARSYLDWGQPVSDPQKGDVVVLKRGSNPKTGHVGFFVGINSDGTIKVLGGNQGDSVKESNFDPEDVLGYRRAKEQM